MFLLTSSVLVKRYVYEREGMEEGTYSTPSSCRTAPRNECRACADCFSSVTIETVRPTNEGAKRFTLEAMHCTCLWVSVTSWTHAEVVPCKWARGLHSSFNCFSVDVGSLNSNGATKLSNLSFHGTQGVTWHNSRVADVEVADLVQPNSPWTNFSFMAKHRPPSSTYRTRFWTTFGGESAKSRQAGAIKSWQFSCHGDRSTSSNCNG